MKVLNFGSMNLDYVYQVDHMVQSGETEAAFTMEVHCGGKGLNQSIALAKAGVMVYHAGMIGEDGGILTDLCRENGVDTTFIKTVYSKNGQMIKTGHAIIQVDSTAQNCILLYGGANQHISKEYVDEVLGNFTEGDYILLQNEISNLDYIIEKAYEKKMIIILNPSPFNEKIETCRLDRVAVFLVNETEGQQITGEKNYDKILQKMAAMYPHARIVLTLGSAGVLYRDEEEMASQEIFPVKAVDTTAAGDTFTGYFIAGMIHNLPIQENLRRCAKASSITVSRKGAAETIPIKEEVEASL